MRVTSVSREDAIKFLEGACRNWSKVPRLSNDDIQDVATELERFATSRPSAQTNISSINDRAEQNYNCPCIHPSQCDDSCFSKSSSGREIKQRLIERLVKARTAIEEEPLTAGQEAAFADALNAASELIEMLIPMITSTPDMEEVSHG